MERGINDVEWNRLNEKLYVRLLDVKCGAEKRKQKNYMFF